MFEVKDPDGKVIMRLRRKPTGVEVLLTLICAVNSTDTLVSQTNDFMDIVNGRACNPRCHTPVLNILEYHESTLKSVMKDMPGQVECLFNRMDELLGEFEDLKPSRGKRRLTCP